MLCGNLNGKEIPKRGDLCIHIADLLCCIMETNATLQSSYSSIKINLKKKRKVSLEILNLPKVTEPVI